MKNQNIITVSFLEKNKCFWFTLIELLITIFILLILSTIWFVSYNWYSSKSRDSVRITDISNFTAWLNLYATNWWLLPNPEWTVSSWTINWKFVTYKWEARENVSKLANLTKVPVDPTTKWYYTYWISFNHKYFQLGATLEDTESTSYIFDKSIFWLSFIYADSSAQYSSEVAWNYLWYIKFSTWGSTYLSNIPSLIYNFSWVTNTWSNLLTWTTTYYVTDDNTNLPYKLDSDTSINNKDWQVILQELTQNSWATLTWVDITSIVNSNWTIDSIFSWSTLQSFWYSLDVITTAIGETNNNNSIAFATPNNCSTWSYSNTWTQTYSLTWTLSHLAYLTWTTSVAISNWTKNYSAKLTCGNWAIIISWESYTPSCNTNYAWSWATSNCIATSPILAWWASTHTEAQCTAAWWTIKAAWAMNLCNFVPWVWWHDCTTLSCINDADTNAHRVAWRCPSGWSRYQNWWSYNRCRLVDWSWDRVNGNRARAYLQYPQAAWSYCMWWPYGMPTVYSQWWNNLAPALQWRANIRWWSDSFTITVWYDRYLWNTWVYWWASTWDWQWQVKTYASMDAIGCY